MAFNTDGARAQLYLNILKHTSEVKVDWKGVAADLGIKHSYNASKKFNIFLKQEGLKFEKDKIVALAEGDKIPKPAKALSKHQKQISATDNDGESPVKKVKKAKSPVEDDEDDED